MTSTDSPTKPAAPLSEEALAEIERALVDSPCATFPMTTEEVRALCQTLRAAWADLRTLRQQVEDTIIVAKTDEDADGFISAYHFQTGAIHRLLAEARKGG